MVHNAIFSTSKKDQDLQQQKKDEVMLHPFFIIVVELFVFLSSEHQFIIHQKTDLHQSQTIK